jgi:hypothetical protein
MRSVVWDFSIPGEVHRRQFLGDRQTSEWVARGVPAHFVIGAMSPLEFASDPEVVRVRAVDDDGRFAIDQLMRPRTNRSSEETLDVTGPPPTAPGPPDAFPGDPSFPTLPSPPGSGPADPAAAMPPTETAPANAVPPGREPLQDGRS